jgi:hypothetical protein
MISFLFLGLGVVSFVFLIDLGAMFCEKELQR